MGSTFGACVAYLATFIVTNIMKKVLMLFHVSFKWDLKLSATPSSSSISTTLKCRRQNKWHSIFKTYIHFKEERFILSLQSLVNSWKLSFWRKRKAFSYTTKCLIHRNYFVVAILEMQTQNSQSRLMPNKTNPWIGTHNSINIFASKEVAL